MGRPGEGSHRLRPTSRGRRVPPRPSVAGSHCSPRLVARTAPCAPSVRSSLGATGDLLYGVRGARPGGRSMVAGRQNLSLRSEYFPFFPNSLSQGVCDSFQATPGRKRFSFLWLLGGSGGQCDPGDCFSTIIIHCLTHEAASTAVIISCLYVGKLRL